MEIDYYTPRRIRELTSGIRTPTMEQTAQGVYKKMGFDTPQAAYTFLSRLRTGEAMLKERDRAGERTNQTFLDRIAMLLQHLEVADEEPLIKHLRRYSQFEYPPTIECVPPLRNRTKQ